MNADALREHLRKCHPGIRQATGPTGSYPRGRTTEDLEFAHTYQHDHYANAHTHRYFEIRDDADDGTRPPLPWQPTGAARLGDALKLARMAKMSCHIYRDGVYLVSYCGGGPYWWPEQGDMHQIGGHGWCHECHGQGLGYVHHLDYDVELAVLTAEGIEDPELRKRLRGDGLTAEQWAASVAGRAVPNEGDESFATDVHELGVGADGLAWFAVDMWSMTTWKIGVEVAPGAPGAASRLAERAAYDLFGVKRCIDCKGSQGRHAEDCAGVKLDKLWAEHLARQAAEVADADIAALEQEAASAGDAEQVTLCQAALDGDTAARAECARVILDFRQEQP